MKTSATLAWRYLSRRPMRAFLTTLAVVLGVALIFGLNGVLPAAMESFQRNIMASSGQVDITVTGTTPAFFDPGLVDRVASVPGVRAATPIVRRAVQLPKGGPVASITVVGVDPSTIGLVRSFPVASGRFLRSGDSGVVALGASTAEKLGVRVGSTISLPGAGGRQEFTVVGVLATPATPGAEEVFVSLADAEQLVNSAGQINEVNASVVSGANRDAVRSAVQRKVGSQYTTAGLSNTSSLVSSLKVSQFAFGMFGVFALVMGGFIILNTFRTVVVERRRDIGMLRAVGASRRDILSMFLVEATLQGALGVGLGLLIGYFIAVGMIAALNPVYKSAIGFTVGPPVFSTTTWVAAIGLGFATTLFAALTPAFGAARISPMEALRPQAAEVAEHHNSWGTWVGLGVIALSLVGLFSKNYSVVGAAATGFLIGLVTVTPAAITPISDATGWLLGLAIPAEGELARSNTQRQPGRAAVTASAVLMSLAIIVALLGVIVSMFAGFNAYLDKSVSGADFVVLPEGLLLGGGNVGADDKFVAKVSNVPGVANVATLRIASTEYKGTTMQAIGIDPNAYPKVASFEFSHGGSAADIAKLSDNRSVIANGVFAAQNGINPGDRIVLRTPNGQKVYEVVGIGNDYLNAKLGTVYMSQDALANDFGVTNNASVLIGAAPGQSIPAVKARLQTIMNDYPQFALYDTASFKALQAKTFDQTKVVFYLLIAVLAFPSLLALLNTLAISVLARTREIGMLRAVGSTRRQISRMVVAESLLLASVGTVFGVIGGVVLGYALVEAMNGVGFPSPYTFPWGGIVAATVIGIGSALLAAILPSRQASKLDIVDALHFE